MLIARFHTPASDHSTFGHAFFGGDPWLTSYLLGHFLDISSLNILPEPSQFVLSRFPGHVRPAKTLSYLLICNSIRPGHTTHPLITTCSHLCNFRFYFLRLPLLASQPTNLQFIAVSFYHVIFLSFLGVSHQSHLISLAIVHHLRWKIEWNKFHAKKNTRETRRMSTYRVLRRKSYVCVNRLWEIYERTIWYSVRICTIWRTVSRTNRVPVLS